MCSRSGHRIWGSGSRSDQRINVSGERAVVQYTPSYIADKRIR